MHKCSGSVLHRTVWCTHAGTWVSVPAGLWEEEAFRTEAMFTNFLCWIRSHRVCGLFSVNTVRPLWREYFLPMVTQGEWNYWQHLGDHYVLKPWIAVCFPQTVFLRWSFGFIDKRQRLTSEKELWRRQTVAGDRVHVKSCLGRHHTWLPSFFVGTLHRCWSICNLFLHVWVILVVAIGPLLLHFEAVLGLCLSFLRLLQVS